MPAFLLSRKVIWSITVTLTHGLQRRALTKRCHWMSRVEPTAHGADQPIPTRVRFACAYASETSPTFCPQTVHTDFYMYPQKMRCADFLMYGTATFLIASKIAMNGNPVQPHRVPSIGRPKQCTLLTAPAFRFGLHGRIETIAIRADAGFPRF